MAERFVHRVMIIEDDARMASIYRQVLELQGQSVEIIAEGAKDALARFEESVSNGKRPDAIIADRRLPDGDGLEVCRRILKISPETTIVLATGDIVGEDVVRAAGIKALLRKPFSMHSLLSAISPRGSMPEESAASDRATEADEERNKSGID